MNNEKLVSRFVRLSKSVTLHWLIRRNIRLVLQSVENIPCLLVTNK